MKQKSLFLILSLLWIPACLTPQQNPNTLKNLHTTESLAAASKSSYQDAQKATAKKDISRLTEEGIAYSVRCLRADPKNSTCLYYNALNQGLFLKNNHTPSYQKTLKIMVQDCETLLKNEPSYANGGCYRILGDIYAKVPSFSLGSKGITRDLDKSVTYLQDAVKIAPDYALNYLFLARSLQANEQIPEAKAALEKFNQMANSGLDQDYPDWQNERNKLAQKLHISKSK